MPEKRPQTCDTCKIRHQKCDAVRPTCHHCKIRNIDCNYSSLSAKPKGVSSVVSGRSKRPAPALDAPPPPPPPHITSRSPSQSEVSFVFGDESNIRDLLRKELVGVDVEPAEKEDLIQSIAQKLSLHALSSISKTEAPTDAKPSPLPLVTPQSLLSLLIYTISHQSGQFPPAILRSLSETKDIPFGPTTIPSAGSHNAGPILPSQFPVRAEAQVWIDTFCNGPNRMVPVATARECQALFDALYDSPEKLAPTDVCVLMYMLATGCRYTDGIPPEIYLHWIHLARCQFEYCVNVVEGSQLWILQPLLLSCSISMHTSPQMCSLMLGLAVQIVRSYRIDQDLAGCGLPEAEYAKWRRVWGSLIFIDVWLAISLGRHPQISKETTGDTSFRDIGSLVHTPELSFDGNLSRYGIIVGKILRDIYATEQADVSSYESNVKTLDTWASMLPFPLRFSKEQSGARDHTAMEQRDLFASLHLELLYYYARMILMRPLLAKRASFGLEASPYPSLNLWAAQACADSAIELGRVSLEMGNRGIVCKRYWLLSAVDYYAALVLLLALSIRASDAQYVVSSAQLQPQIHTQHSIAENGVTMLQQMLSLCAQQERSAQHFLEVTQILQSRVGGSLDGSILNNSFRKGGSHAVYYDVSMRTAPTNAPQSSAGNSPYSSSAFSTEGDSYPSTATSTSRMRQPMPGFASSVQAQVNPTGHLQSVAVPDTNEVYYDWPFSSLYGPLPDGDVPDGDYQGMHQ